MYSVLELQFFLPTEVLINTFFFYSDGFKFYWSANNVILCPGNEQGFLPPQYFEKVMQTKPSKYFILISFTIEQSTS